MLLRDLAFDIEALHAAFRAGVKPSEVVNECFRRIRAPDDPGIFIHLIDEAEAQVAASRLGPFDPVAKPLWGIPFAVKDNIDVAGVPTTAGCPDYAYDAEADAFVVERLKAAGAICVGKTNLDQFATGLVGVRTPFPVPRNSLDPEIVPGGSSSGSAVAVALGAVSFALGTDTAGSGRVPAALNNIVGLKPSLGSLSATGLVPACRTLDTISVFALTVPDAYRAFAAAAAYDPADPYSRDRRIGGLGALPPAVRVGVPTAESRRFLGDSAQAACFDRAVARVEALGATTVEVDLAPFYQVAEMLYDGVWVAERHAVIEGLLSRDADAVHPTIRQVVSKAEAFSATDAFRSFYRLEALRREVTTAMTAVDLLCVPSIPTFFTLADLERDPIGPNTRLGTYTNFVNLLDLCGTAVPVAARSDGRPGSVTVLAPAGGDAAAAALAAALHRDSGVTLGATRWPQPEPPTPAPAAEADEIALAVVGAHMSGLPLNSELTRVGGRFLKAARTSPAYRLYCLPGGPPSRPGLVRDEDGASIALEVWALPEARFGGFMRGVPGPLGIGTIALEDGEMVKGFLCETAGLTGAIDITHHGGWRRFLSAEPARHGTVS